jgi:hypothetical protein
MRFRAPVSVGAAGQAVHTTTRTPITTFEINEGVAAADGDLAVRRHDYSEVHNQLRQSALLERFDAIESADGDV